MSKHFVNGAGLESPDASSKNWRDWIGLLAIWLTVTGYNLFKPYHIDDTVHLMIARWIIHNPLHPMSGLLNWDNYNEPIWHTNQPHLLFYLMAAWGSFFGFSEASIHALISSFALLCIVLFYRLSRFYDSNNALWATALLCIGPAFIVEQNAMVDVPLLALWLLFFYPLITGELSSNQNARYCFAAIACAAALLVKYSSLVLIPCLATSIITERRWKQAWVVTIPILVLSAWSIFNVTDYGGIHILQRPIGSKSLSLSARLIGAGNDWIVYIGGLQVLGLVLISERLKPRLLVFAAYIGAIALFCLFYLLVARGVISDSEIDKVLRTTFKLNAIILLVFIVWGVRHVFVRDGSTLRDRPTRSVMIWCWLITTSVFYVMFSPFVAARHVLLILPPIILLALDAIPTRLSSSSKAVTIGFTAFISAGLCIADWQIADFFRQEAPRLAMLQSSRSHVYTNGHWGWQWYASQHGIDEVDVRRLYIRPEDIIVLTPGSGSYPFERRKDIIIFEKTSMNISEPDLFCTLHPTNLYMSIPFSVPWTLTRQCGTGLELGHLPPDYLKKGQVPS